MCNSECQLIKLVRQGYHVFGGFVCVDDYWVVPEVHLVAIVSANPRINSSSKTLQIKVFEGRHAIQAMDQATQSPPQMIGSFWTDDWDGTIYAADCAIFEFAKSSNYLTFSYSYGL